MVRHRRGTPPQARIKGLIYRYEFPFRWGPGRRRWGPHHNAYFRQLIRPLGRVSQGPISVLNHRHGTSQSKHSRAVSESQSTWSTSLTLIVGPWSPFLDLNSLSPWLAGEVSIPKVCANPWDTGCRFTGRRKWARASRRTPSLLPGGPRCGRSAPGGRLPYRAARPNRHLRRSSGCASSG